MQVIVILYCEFLRPVLGPPVQVQVTVGGALKGAKLALKGFELFMNSILVMLKL